MSTSGALLEGGSGREPGRAQPVMGDLVKALRAGRGASRDGRSRSGGHGGVAQSESGPSGKRPIGPSWRSRVSRSGPIRRTLGSFCKRSGVFKGIPSLCKRYNTCKVWHRCESGGIAVKTAPGGALGQRGSGAAGQRGSGSLTPEVPAVVDKAVVQRRIGTGNHLLGQVNPHWGRLLSCPNAPQPTPMHFNLPQCGRTPAHRAFDTPAPADSHCESGWERSKTRLGPSVFGGLRAWMVRNARARTKGADGRWAPRVGGPKRVWV